MPNKILEYLGRSIVTYLNGNYHRFNIYKSQAVNLYKEIKFNESCRYPIRNMIPEDTKNKLYEMVN